MASIFNSLNIGYTGLNVAQIGINTTGQNIANAETEGYSRKRVIQSAATPLKLAPGNVGNGVEVQDIERIFDEFVFRRYTSTYTDKENSDFTKKTLEELSTYFPEIDNVGIKTDLREFYNLWQDFADNPNDNAIKVALITQAKTLTDDIKQLNEQVYNMQKKLNDELKANIDEVNAKAKEIANLNKAINEAEAGGGYTANDLRDKRNLLERDLARLIGATPFKGEISTNITIDPSSTKTSSENYTLNINGFNIVDGTKTHPIVVDDSNSSGGFYEVFYERQDGFKIPFAEEITDGKIGAILSLRGDNIDTTTGLPTDGIIQNVYSQINAFATGFIESINNIYAKVGVESMVSNEIEFDTNTTPLVYSGKNIKEGSFNIVVYDTNGDIVAQREITINQLTTIQGVSNSIESQINSNLDDNSDNNATNDIDDMIQFSVLSSPTTNIQLSLLPEFKSLGYRFAISDNLTTNELNSGTNFAGALGLNRFFDGQDAKDIDVTNYLEQDPSKLQAGRSEILGDNSVALSMIQHQYEKFDFFVNQTQTNSTTYEYFDSITSYVGIQTATAITKNDTLTAQFNTVEQEYESVTKVSIDEELTNLIRYQTAYGASAKVIQTIDQMINTLLGLKQ